MKGCTDIEQSKVLAEFLPLKSADMYYYCSKESNTLISESPFVRSFKETNTFSYLPCWSLAALLDVLPKGTRLLKSATDDIYHCDCPKWNIDEWFDNPIDACYEIILKLYELKML